MKAILFLAFVFSSPAWGRGDPVQDSIFRKAVSTIESSRDAHRLYLAPGWGKESGKAATWAAKGWFQGSNAYVTDAIWAMMSQQGFTPMRKLGAGTQTAIQSEVFYQRMAFIKESAALDMMVLYVLQATTQEKGPYVLVNWSLAEPVLPVWKMDGKYNFQVHPHPEYGNEYPDIVMGTQQEAEVKIQAGQLAFARQLMASGGPLQIAEYKVDPGLDRRLESDWNYRLWTRLKPGNAAPAQVHAAAPAHIPVPAKPNVALFERKGRGYLDLSGLLPPAHGTTLGYIIHISTTPGSGYRPYNDKGHPFLGGPAGRLPGFEEGKTYYLKVSAFSDEGKEAMGPQEIKMQAKL